MIKGNLGVPERSTKKKRKERPWPKRTKVNIARTDKDEHDQVGSNKQYDGTCQILIYVCTP